MPLQVSWAPNSTTVRTWGRPDDGSTPPPPPPTADFLAAVSGAAVGTVTPPPPPPGFTHPGVLLGLPQLDFVKARLVAAQAPWTTEYTRMLNQAASATQMPNSANAGRQYSSLSWTPNPWAVVGRGSSGSNSEGDQDEQGDATAAYTHALIWYYTGARANAVKSIQILNAWSAVLRSHKFDTTNYADGLLQSAWTGAMWPRAAEIMRYTFTPTGTEPTLNLPNMDAMLRQAHVVNVQDGWTGGGFNWLMTMAEALMNISVYLDDNALYAKALSNWRQWTKAGVWRTGDVNQWPQLAGLPISPRLTLPNRWNNTTTYDKSTTSAASLRTYWYSPTSWPSGLSGETGRDPWHMAMGFGSIFNAAETARLQGADLYGEEQSRLTTALELNCGFLHEQYVDGHDPVAWPFAASGTWGTRATDVQRMTWEMAYNHYRNRNGVSLPNTLALLQDYVRGTGYRATLHFAYEPLTHNGVP